MGVLFSLFSLHSVVVVVGVVVVVVTQLWISLRDTEYIYKKYGVIRERRVMGLYNETINRTCGTGQ